VLFHYNKGYTNAPQCYVIRTLRVFFISRLGLIFILKLLYHFNQATRRHIPKYCRFKNQCLLSRKFYSAVVTHHVILLDQLRAIHTALRMSGNKISFRCVQSVVIWTYCHWGPPCHCALKCHIFVINFYATWRTDLQQVHYFCSLLQRNRIVWLLPRNVSCWLFLCAWRSSVSKHTKIYRTRTRTWSRTRTLKLIVMNKWTGK